MSNMVHNVNHLSKFDLGIESHLPVWFPCLGEPLHQSMNAGGLAGAAGAKDHDAMADLGSRDHVYMETYDVQIKSPVKNLPSVSHRAG